MLFLGNIGDILKTDVNAADNLSSALKALALMTSNTVLVSECKDINYVQLNQGVYDEIDLEVYDEKSTKDDIDEYSFPAIWNKYVVFHADFSNHNLAAGNFDYMIGEVKSVIVKKRPANSVEPWLPVFEKKIYSETDSNEFNFVFTDYLVRNRHEYEYKLVPILTGGMEGFPIYAAYEDENHKAVDFDGVFICEPNSVYSTILDVEVTAQKNKPSSVITTIGKKYPYVLCGTENNYYTGTVRGLFAPSLKKYDWDFEDSWNFREKFNEFLLNGKVKLLKYHDGRMWLTNIYDNVTNDREEHDYKIITSFNWAEIGDVTDVYSLYDNGFISYNPYTKTPEITDDYDYGKVIYAGQVTDINGNKIAPADIKLYDSAGNVINTTSANSMGRFSFSGLRDGEYNISVTAAGYAPAFTNLSVDGHKPMGANRIILTEIKDNESAQPDNSEYDTLWKVLRSAGNDDFDKDDIYDNATTPSSLINTNTVNSEVVLLSDFTVKKGDTVTVFIKGTYNKEDVPDEILNTAGHPCLEAAAYTGTGPFEDGYDGENINHICSSQITLKTNGTETSFSKTTTSDSAISGNLKLSLFAEEFDNQGYNLYSEITGVLVAVNGKNIFKMG